MSQIVARPTRDPLVCFQVELEPLLDHWAFVPDEAGLDPVWLRAQEEVRSYTLRHDVADRANVRRGRPSLHKLLGKGRLGEDLAIVAGDHLYARAMEAMMSAPSPHAVAASQFMLRICRHTAAGQHLDLTLSRAPLEQVRLFQTLKVAHLKTAQYGFVAPLVCGAMLGGAAPGTLDALARIGRLAGLAYQLRDDLIGLYGEDKVTGKDGGGDFFEGKRTFPVVAAWTRADANGRRTLEALWNTRTEPQLATARLEVARWGGVTTSQRVVDRLTRTARRTLASLGHGPAVEFLDGMLTGLARRVA
ncbi:MAG: farnesyltranstransferase [Myxococcaceae bacterium]|nr:farnesyltranstransferase [Myxococcaceae bacterium]